MKINTTLVKSDGLYGMVMPEKLPTIEEMFYETDMDLEVYQELEKAYNGALQAARDAAVRYEDQEHATAICDSITAVVLNGSLVYPLPEPLECKQIWQWAREGRNEWYEYKGSVNELDSNFEYRQVLRISQGADNKEHWGIKIANKILERQNSAHGYTEGYKIPVSFGQSNEAGVIRRLGACSSERDDNSDVTDRHLSDWVNGGFGRAKNINTEVSESTPLIEQALNDAFVAGKSKQSFESFKKEWYANLRS